MDQETCRQIFERVKSFSTAPEVEVLIHGGRHSLTRFANNAIHQNVNDHSMVVSVRPVIEKKTARATTNKTDDESLRRAVEQAERLARIQEPDPDLLPLAGADAAGGADAPSRFFEATRAISPEARADGVKKIVEVAKEHSLVTAGIFATGESFEAILNSEGLEAFHRETNSEISITMLAGDSSGWQKANSPDVRHLDAEGLARVAAEKARNSAAPKELAPGKYTVVLEPAAVLDLMGFLFWDFGAQSVLDERSCLNKRMGTKLFGENISVSDDAYHPLQSGAPFDGEGVRRQKVELIRKGVAANLVYARATAAKMKKSGLVANLGRVTPTGHGFPLPNEIGDAPVNIVFAGPAAGQARSVDQMVQETERGVLVTRFWYIREVEPYEKIVTGMTRDGTFLVEGGKVRHGLLNFRFNQSLVEMLQRVVAMGEPLRASGEESFDMVVPAMKVEGFNFTEVTRF